MTIHATCQSCGQKLKAADSAAGKRAKCPKCGQPVLLPEPVYDAEDVTDPAAEPDPYRLSEPAGEAPTEEASAGEPDRRPCPMCGEMIISTAVKCRYCGEVFDATLRRDEARRTVDPELVRRFRREVHGLGGAWIFFGTVSLIIGAALLAGTLPANRMADQGRQVAGGVIVVVAVMWLTVGVFACLKHLWAIYVGLGVSYLGLVGNLARFNVCGLLILLAIVIQAHRAVMWAHRMRRANLPLTTRPERMRRGR